jgi:hypothetical protein
LRHRQLVPTHRLARVLGLIGLNRSLFLITLLLVADGCVGAISI